MSVRVFRGSELRMTGKTQDDKSKEKGCENMQVRTIVTVLGEVFGWYPAGREYISTIQRDGQRSVVRSRIPSKVWNYFLEGINVRLLREGESVRTGENIEAVMLYRGGKIRRLSLISDAGGGVFTVALTGERDISYNDADRALQMFNLKLESLMKERMAANG